MIYFAQSQYLLLLVLVPVFLALYGLARYLRKKKIRRFGDKLIVGFEPLKLFIRQAVITAVIFAVNAQKAGGY